MKTYSIATASFVAASVLAACASPSLTLLGRDSGDLGTGSVEGVYLRNSGPIEIALRGETYRGTWVAVRNAGSASFGLLNAYGSSSGTLTASGVGISQSDSGFGTAILQSEQGRGMRCEYRYSTVTVTATGVCRHEDGEVFDLQVG